MQTIEAFSSMQHDTIAMLVQTSNVCNSKKKLDPPLQSIN